MTRVSRGEKDRRPNDVLAQRRTELRLSHEKLAYLLREKADERNVPIGSLSSVTRHIKRIEAGDVRDPSPVYRDLLCAVLRRTESGLFGTVALHHEMRRNSDGQLRFKLRNHKLIPTFIGVDAAMRAIDELDMQAAEARPIQCYCTEIRHPRPEVKSNLWIWPFGVAMFHLSEEVELSDLATFAIWHRHIYDEQMSWANQTIQSILKCESSSAQYAMPINWLARSIWSRRNLNAALRIITTPRILLQRMADTESSDLAHAQLVESALLNDGFEQFDSSDFGIEGTSVGVASWSGIVYFPVASNRALSESEILTYERTVQAAWSYCDWIRSQVEAGRDPEVLPQYGRRLLRALRSFITNPRPEESPQIYPLRTAILETSGITEHLNQATEAIGEL